MKWNQSGTGGIAARYDQVTWGPETERGLLKELGAKISVVRDRGKFSVAANKGVHGVVDRGQVVLLNESWKVTKAASKS